MNDFELGPIVARVEAGERLSPEDLDRLADRARQPGAGVDWVLCFAHALINADRHGEALGLLDPVVRRETDEPLVRLARARALGALERHREAEADLRHILARRPRHADTLRALALLRLRAGAAREALHLVEQVLETDPLDDIALQIREEARAALDAPGELQRPATVEDFARDLTAALAERGVKSRVDPDRNALLIKLGADRLGRLDLAKLWEACVADPRGRAAHLESLVGSLSRLGSPAAIPALDEVRERIVPVLRPPAFLARTGPALHAPGPAGLLWLYALDHPEFVSFLPPACAEQWGLPVEEIARIAVGNLDRSPHAPSRFRITRTGLGELPANDARWDLLGWDRGDGYDAARVLAPAHRALLAGVAPGPWAIAFPSASYCLLARSDDRDAVAFLRGLLAGEAVEVDTGSRELYRSEAPDSLAAMPSEALP